MKILFPYLARWKAVNWTRYHSLLTKLAAVGHEIHIIQTPRMNSAETNFQDIDVNIPENMFLYEAEINKNLWKRKWPVDKLFKKGFYALSILPMVKTIVVEKDIDVLLLYNIPHYPLLRINGCVKVFDYADDYKDMLEYELGIWSNPLLLKLLKSLLYKMMKKTDITFSVSNVLAESSVVDVCVLPNGVNLVGTNIGFEKHIMNGYKRPIVGFIGSFEYFIDFDLILNAAKLLPSVTFLLVGSGRQLKYVSDKINELSLHNVYLTGGVPHREVFKYIYDMDICLNIFKKLPISHGACPIKLFEYLVMKKPVISTRIKEVENINEGFVFFADTTEELVNSINKISTDKGIANEYVNRGYNAVVNKYTWGKIADRFIEEVEKHM